MADQENRHLEPRPSALGPDEPDGLVRVAAGALVDPDGRVLLTRRHDDTHQGGLWEFPGGKLEPGESVTDGLARELHEELAIEVTGARPLIRVLHHYPDRSVLLDVHRVDAWSGEPHGREGQPLEWVAPGNLDDYPMPAADLPIVRALQLPDFYLITPPRVSEPKAFLEALEASLASGIRLVQLRLFDLTDPGFESLGRDAVRLCHAAGAQVLLNGTPDRADAIGADGLHLNGRGLRRHAARPVAAERLLAASCHTPEDLAFAAELGADFAVLSPVLPTPSHPDAEPLGWERFATWTDAAAIPVFALGGMRPDLVETAWRHGGQGIAGIRGLWGGPVD